jgi:hypothetical protein
MRVLIGVHRRLSMDRKWREATRAFALVAVAMTTGCAGTIFVDISPNAPSGFSSGGLTYALTGADAGLYAVSLDAGLWSSPTSRIWTQLRGPRYALSVAVDPADPTHLAVGERNGDAREVRLNEAGVWESFDTGITWSYTLNPLVLPDPSTGTVPCSSQVVPSVIFTKNSTLVAGTACGIARKAKGAASFTAATAPAGTGFVSALVASQTKVWARTLDGRLLVSVDDGKTFAAATSKPLPSGVGFGARGDDFSLAASDDAAAMSGCCASGGPGPVNGHLANEMIIYNVGADSWTVEPILDASGTSTTEGVYVGGRRFMRSFNTGTGVRFFFCNAQAVWEVDLAGTHTLIASSGVDIPAPSNANFAGGIHSDLWDFALDPAGQIMWIASDGGVYETRSDGTGWKSAVTRLHTQHVQTLDVVLAPGATQVAYTTQDNDAWFGMEASWNTTGQLGDANWSDADAGNPAQSFFGRGLRSFVIQSLDGISPTFNWRATPSILTDPSQPAGPLFLQFIQSVKGEAGVPLDAVMLLNRPVLDASNPPRPIVPAPALAGLAQSGGPWLLRNRSWASEPDFYRAVAVGNWSAELTDLPAGTDRVFVSGGHAFPHYFALVRESSGLSLFERKQIPILGVPPAWVRVLSGAIEWSNHCSFYQGWYGPVFVNPYDASKVFLLTSGGVKVSHRDSQGNLVFADDVVLTNLITASNSFPIEREFCGGNPSQVPIASRTLGTSTLAHVAFFRGAPNRTVVASPFTGGFYDNGDGIWRGFSNLLPRAPLWAVRLDDSNAYFGFAGRSVGRVTDPGDAARATYFEPDRGFLPRLGGGLSIVAKLLVSDGTVAAGETVSLRIIAPDGTMRHFVPSLKLDSDGRVLVPPATPGAGLVLQPGFVIHIHFEGDEQRGLAASEIHFVY